MINVRDILEAYRAKGLSEEKLKAGVSVFSTMLGNLCVAKEHLEMAMAELDKLDESVKARSDVQELEGSIQKALESLHEYSFESVRNSY